MRIIDYPMMSILFSCCLLVGAGCDINLLLPTPETTAQAKAQAESVGTSAGDALTRAEQTLGREIVTPEAAETYGPRARQAATIAEYGETGARAASSFLPSEYQPWAEGAAVVFGVGNAAAAALAAFYARQKRAAIKAAVATAENLPGGGSVLHAEAGREGIRAAVEKEYAAQVAAGAAGKSATSS